MTYQLERDAIETYLDTAWQAAEPTVPIGLPDHDFTPVAESLQFNIKPGAVLQASTGQAGSNRIEHVGLVMVRIYSAGGKGEAAWRGHVDTLDGILSGARLDNAGAVETGIGEFIRFSHRDLYPYVVGSAPDGPLLVTTYFAPFVRFETG